jgi:DNA/RNA endonuclease YhcR with UshA esterase domain
MRRIRLTKPTPVIAGLLIGLLFAILAVPLGAQPASAVQPYYDIAREVTLSGTVSSVFKKAPAGMTVGSHLMLATSSGTVDASLGRWGMEGKGALSVATGQHVEVTGVMKTYKDRELFVARTVKVGGQVYTMRNQHGIAVSPQSRARAGQKTAALTSRAAKKGESL